MRQISEQPEDRTGRPPGAAGPRAWWRESVCLRALLLLGTLFVFFLAINLLGSALNLLAGTTVRDILAEGTSSPVAALLLGIILTSIILASGFAIMGLGSFAPTYWFGLVSTFVLSMALLSALVVLPAAVLFFRPRL